MGTNKGFTGHYADATGLDYYNARYYDPVASVFLSVDSVQGNLQGMNPYGYVQGNPETRSDPTGQHVVCGDTCGGGNGSGGGNPTPPPPPPPNTCTQESCSVTVEGKTYPLNQLKTSVTDRVTFLQLLYDQLANGYGNSEISFVNYLITSGRLHLSAYWNSVDFQVIRDQLLAAYDFLHHLAGQSSLINNWLTFFAHPNTNGWWVAHNDSINAGDQQARTDGLYAKESGIEQDFINETIHVLGDVQYAAQSPLSFLFDPRSSTTATLTSIFYPQQYNDFATGTSLFFQGVTASVGVAVVGTIVGAVGGPVGIAVGAVTGITGGATFFQSLLTSP